MLEKQIRYLSMLKSVEIRLKIDKLWKLDRTYAMPGFEPIMVRFRLQSSV